MKNRGAWLAVSASLAAVLACGSSNNGTNNSGNGNNGGGFPYSGPSCNSTIINQGCWGCLENSCNGSCLTNACSDFFNCFCNCAQGNNSCYQGCAGSISQSCQQCVLSISSCEMSSCSSACGNTGNGSGGVTPPGPGPGGSGSGSSSGGGMFLSCGGSGQVCAGGASLQFCQTGIANMCTSAYYQVGSQTFICASCTDTASCEQEAQAACGTSVIDAGPPPDDVGPPDSPVFDAVAATCHSHACGTMGQSMTYCEVDDGEGGACTQAWYQVGGQVFDCTDCSQAGCQAAAQEASKACP